MVSNLGNIKSVDRTVIAKDGRSMKFKGRPLKAFKNKFGLAITLSYEHKSELHQISRLVFAAFKRGKMPLNIYHLDGDVENNYDTNLTGRKPKKV